MHLHAFTIERLSLELGEILIGKTFYEIFSISNNEIYFSSDVITLKITFFKGEALLQKIADDKLPRRNKVNQFEGIYNKKIIAIQCAPYDRVISFKFEKKWIMKWNLFGRFSHILILDKKASFQHFPLKSNPILTEKDKPVEESLRENPNFSLSDIQFLGKTVVEEMTQNSDGDSIESMFDRLQKIRKTYLQSTLFVVSEKHSVLFTYNKVNDFLFKAENILDTLHFFAGKFTYLESFNASKAERLKEVNKEIQKTESKIISIHKSIFHIENNDTFKTYADLLMAYAHLVSPSEELASLPSFDGKEMVIIKIKKGISPQDNATRYYQKAKSEKKQLFYLKESLLTFQDKLQALLKEKITVENSTEIKILNKEIEAKKSKQQNTLPYKTSQISGYEIRIGKGAHQNDELLRRYCSKNDLWFHIKNFSGSHVVLRNPGKNKIPLDAIERVAEIAAFYSKGKNENLAAVIYTYCKYVRKPKKANPGAVIVDKEEVILVSPKGLT